MEETRYLDFDLSVERIGENIYRSRVLASPAGLAKAEFNLPFSALEIENFVLKVGRTRRMVRRIESPEMQIAKEFGSKLYKAVFNDDIQSALRSSLDQARAQGVGLRIRLRMNDAPELVDIPWEYLYNPTLNRFLALSVNTPVVRYLELPESIQPLAVKLPLRVLVMIANPKNYPALDVESEWRNLKQAVSDLEERGLLSLERLEPATPVALQRSLRRQEYHIFHFIGHGGFDESAQDGMLLLEDENGLGRPLSGQALGTILHDEDSLRLVVLNACEGARSGKNDPFSGTAQSLVQQGLPAVIAMQFEVSDAAAITFAHEFYAALADSLPVDAALGEARKVIFSSGNEIEWGTPVLYLRATDGLIFKFDRSVAAVETTSASEVTPVVKKQKTVAAVNQQPRAVPIVKPAARSRESTWLALITTTFGFWAGWAAFVYWFDEQLFYDGVATTLILGTLVGLLMGGGITAGFFIMGFRIKLKHLVGILPTWMGSLAVNLFVLSYIRVEGMYEDANIVLALLALVAVVLAFTPGHLVTVFSLRAERTGLPWKTAWLLSAGWLVGLLAGCAAIAFISWINGDTSLITAYLAGGLIGGLGGAWMVRILGKDGEEA